MQSDVIIWMLALKHPDTCQNKQEPSMRHLTAMDWTFTIDKLVSISRAAHSAKSYQAVYIYAPGKNFELKKTGSELHLT